MVLRLCLSVPDQCGSPSLCPASLFYSLFSYGFAHTCSDLLLYVLKYEIVLYNIVWGASFEFNWYIYIMIKCINLIKLENISVCYESRRSTWDMPRSSLPLTLTPSTEDVLNVLNLGLFSTEVYFSLHCKVCSVLRAAIWAFPSQ